MNLEIIAPDKKLFKGTVKLVQVPGSKGSFEILKDHAPIISTLEKGRIKIMETDKTEPIFFEINGGVIEVKKNEIIILAK